MKLARRQVVVAQPDRRQRQDRRPVAAVRRGHGHQDNIDDTVIKDGFHRYDEVYRGVPEASRPPRCRAAMSAARCSRRRGITKRFPGVTALGGVNFDLRPGEVHALCGENGAGKSHADQAAGRRPPARQLRGRAADRRRSRPGSRSPRDAERAGIAVIYQELALVPEMTVAENMFLGARRAGSACIDWNAIYARARAMLDEAAASTSIRRRDRRPRRRAAAARRDRQGARQASRAS